MNDIIYFHIPGFFEYFSLNKKLIELMETKNECFIENYKIGSIYGSFPNAIWNGGRVCFGICFKEDIEECVRFYNEHNIPLRYTFTNSLIDVKHLNDTYCNMIMEVSNNGFNQVLVNSSILEEHIRKNYPKYKIISSTTKRVIDKNELNEELDKDYHLVVLDYDLNKDFDYLELIKQKDKIEILVDELCGDKCPYRKEHYNFYADSQLNFKKNNAFECKFLEKSINNFDEIKNNHNFISNKEINKYIDMGFRNFKLVGRLININFVIDSYVYYLVKPEFQNQIKLELIKSIMNGGN